MAEGDEIRFGGAVAVNPLQVSVQSSQEGGLRWYQVLEQAFLKLTETEEGKALYGDPQRGATLEQAWRTQFLLSQMSPVCLLATGRPPTPTEAIPRVIRLSPSQLADALSRVLTKERRAAQTFVHTGVTGHCVTLLSYEPGSRSFTFVDPWPGRSLLCKENNTEGVDAQQAEGNLWRVTADELARVIFASFFAPTDWADLTGVEYRLSFAALRATDFWSFFHLRETARKTEEDDTITVSIAPGGFREEIDLSFQLEPPERVSGGTLRLRRRWILGPPMGVNPFALDITRSFLTAVAPAPDREEVEALVGTLRQLPDLEFVKALAAREQEKPSAAGQLVATYLGAQPEGEIVLTFCRLHLTNAERDGEPWWEMRLRLY